MRQPSAMPWPSSAVNSGPRRLSQAHGITETRRNSQPTCSAAFCSSPADRPDVQTQAQGTSHDWYQTRTAETPAVLDHNQAGMLPETLTKLRKAGYTLVIIDTPGIDNHGTRGAMQTANLCLIPVRPSEADMKATMPTVAALHGMGKRFALVVNQASTNRQARITSAVIMRLSSNGVVVPVPNAERIG